MDDDSVVYYGYNISRIGKYYAESLNLPLGSSVAYLASAPLESMYALDAALKVANVRMVEFWGPPTVTNCGGALLTGSQSACEAAVRAFGDTVQRVVDNPLEF
jgi:ethanolamine utilization protein EutL